MASSLFTKGAAIVVFSLLATSCSDETFDNTSDAGREIRFDVSAAGEKWVSRSGNSTNGTTSQATLEMNNGYGDKLYLHPVVTDNVEALSRGSVTDNDNIETAGIFAGYNTGSMTTAQLAPDYMWNVKITRDNSWTPTAEYLWPGTGNLHITAYSPYVTTPSATGITSVPQIDEKGDWNLGYTVPATTAQQFDLMRATPVDASSSPCKLSFNHALTAIQVATGAEMAPCTVVSVEINNVKNAGTLDLETGKWSDLKGVTSYTVATETELTVATGETYVAPNTLITPVDSTLFLMPQTLGEDAAIAVTILRNGETTRYEASLAGATWEAGKTVVYNLSVNPGSNSLRFEINGDFTAPYTGDSIPFTVTSLYNSETGQSTPINWKAEFIDDNGNVINRPEWVKSFPMTGSNDSSLVAVTKMHTFVFDAISAESQILQNAADINATSGLTPYNLASSTGTATIENTANCYIINAPGIYSIPLVYGNAIKNGTTNAAAYTSTSHRTGTLKNFVNHLENNISDPYIYNNTGCEPQDAVLVWEDHICLIDSIALSEDKKNIIVNIPPSSIRQGNAVVAVRDADGSIMWSWQLWVTDFVPENETRSINNGNTSVNYMSRDIGRIVGSDITRFPESKVSVRFTQLDVPDGLEALTQTIEITQTEKTISTGDSFTLYQWGRKDPIVGHVNQWYNADHQEITVLPTSDVNIYGQGTGVLAAFIKTPQTLWTATHNHTFTYTNLWNTNQSTTSNVKSIYDPSPAGYKVPLGNELLSFANDTTVHVSFLAQDEGTRKAGFYINQNNGDTLFFPAYGYRSGTTGNENGYGIYGEWWISFGNTSDARVFILNVNAGNPTKQFSLTPRTHCMGIFPMKEE